MKAIARLLDVMAKLRDPDRGCPWDVAQSYATIAPYTIEEAYEVAEAISQEDWPALKDELGDLLFQVVFYAQMAREDGLFDFEAIAPRAWPIRWCAVIPMSSETAPWRAPKPRLTPGRPKRPRSAPPRPRPGAAQPASSTG